MSIENKNIGGGLPNIEVYPADEIVADRNHAWHAIRGYDFAGLERILKDGLSPADNQGDNVVCLSASPTVSRSVRCEANSFYAYTLGGGLSLSVSTPAVAYPSGNHCGLVDEVRQTRVRASEIDGVMLPSSAVSQRLVDALAVHDVRKPKQAVAYVKRTLRHLSKLGVKVDGTTAEMAAATVSASRAKHYIKKEDTQRLEGAFMKTYASFLQKEHGISEPTVSDMLAVVLDRARRSGTAVYAYDEALKQEVGRANARIAKAKSALGGVSLSDIFY